MDLKKEVIDHITTKLMQPVYYAQKAKAKITFEKLSETEKVKLQQNIIAGLPGAEESYTVENFLKVLHGLIV